MANKNLPIKEVMEEEAARLRVFWERYKAKMGEEMRKGHVKAKNGRPKEFSQTEFAETYLGMTGANFGHILNGRQPIRLETLFDLAVLLDFDPREVRPSIQSHIDKVFRSVRGADASLVLAYLEQLTPTQRAGVLDFARYINNPATSRHE